MAQTIAVFFQKKTIAADSSEISDNLVTRGAHCVQCTSKLTAHSGKRRGVEAAIDPDQLDISSLAQSQILNHVSLSR